MPVATRDPGGNTLREQPKYSGADNSPTALPGTAPSPAIAQSGFPWASSDAGSTPQQPMKGAVPHADSSASAPGNESDSRREDANGSQVGGRQSPLRLPAVGGGYQDVCTIFGAGAAAAAALRAAVDDPRIRELREVGIPRVWIRVARAIGFDAFVTMWQVLMKEEHVDDRCRVVVPNYGRYLRFQRNRLIRQLIAEGFGVDEIRVEVKKATGEDVSESHIRRAGQRS